MPDFAARLAALGLKQVQLRHWIEAITGRKIAQSTTSRLATGKHEPNVFADALLTVIEKPELLEELRK